MYDSFAKDPLFCSLGGTSLSYTFKKGRLKKFGREAVEKAAPRGRALQKLRSFLDRKEPDLAYILVTLWRHQGEAITYKEIREAILAGELSEAILEGWRQDYSKFVKEHLEPGWLEAIEQAIKDLGEKYPEWHYDPMAEGTRDWAAQRGAEFVTSVTETQMEGLRAVIQRAAGLEDMTVDMLARAIRPMVGLYHQQTVANLKYYESLIRNGVGKKRALDLSIRYSSRMHRYRAYNIARTELAFAYNQGSFAGTKQAQAAGYMGRVEKVWCTADDERVCSICGALEGNRYAMDDDIYYDYTDSEGNVHQRRINHKLNDELVGRVPPAHPSCRCTLLYEEVEPPEMYR